MCHLHLQGVLRMRAKTVRGITSAIKRHLGWDQGKQPFGSRVMCRELIEKKLHTWQGLLGYCCKDLHEDHFEVRISSMPRTTKLDCCHAMCMAAIRAFACWLAGCHAQHQSAGA